MGAVVHTRHRSARPALDPSAYDAGFTTGGTFPYHFALWRPRNSYLGSGC